MAPEFDQEGLEEISRSNYERLARLRQMGIQIGGINEGYMGRLLEYLCGDAVPRLKMEQQLWVAEQLDTHEEAIQKQRLEIARGDSPFAQRN